MVHKKTGSRGDKRRQWDIILKWIFEETITSAGLTIDIFPEVELGKQPPRIDLLLQVTDVNRLSSYNGPLSFIIRRLHKVTLVEFKSMTDSVTKGLTKRLVGHWGHYGDQLNVSWSSWKNDFAGLLLLAKDSETIISDLYSSEETIVTISKGVYRLDFPFKILIIDFSQLPVTVDTIPLVLLTKQTKRQQAIEKIFKTKKLLNYLEVCYWLYPQEVKTIADTLSQDLPLNIKKAVEIIGISTVIDEVGFDTILKEIGREKIEKWLIEEKKKDSS